MLNLKNVFVLCWIICCIPILVHAADHPADLKQVSAGDWSIERTELQYVIARLADEVSTDTVRIKFVLEGWDELTSKSVRPNGITTSCYNYNIQRFPVDTKGKNLAEVLDLITTGHGGYEWRYDAKSGIVNVIDKRLVKMPAWAMNQPLSHFIKKETISSADVRKVLVDLKCNNTPFPLGDLEEYPGQTNMEFYFGWGKNATKSLKPILGGACTVRDLVNYLLGEKQEKYPGGSYKIFIMQESSAAMKQLQEGTIPEWWMGGAGPLKVATLKEIMRWSDMQAEKIKNGYNPFEETDKLPPPQIQDGIYRVSKDLLTTNTQATSNTQPTTSTQQK